MKLDLHASGDNMNVRENDERLCSIIPNKADWEKLPQMLKHEFCILNIMVILWIKNHKS